MKSRAEKKNVVYYSETIQTLELAKALDKECPFYAYKDSYLLLSVSFPYFAKSMLKA